jgi:hypothetical protein
VSQIDSQSRAPIFLVRFFGRRAPEMLSICAARTGKVKNYTNTNTEAP